jgi:hypothetical protein
MYRSSFSFLTIVVLFVSIFLLFPLLTSAEEKHEYSGFLDDYPKFEVNEKTGAEIWFKSNEKGVLVLKPYYKILLSPIEVWLNNDASYKGINPDELKAITDYFATAIKKELGSMYPVATEPGPGVLHLRIAITNVKRSKPKRKWYGYIPAALVVEGGKKVAQSAAGKGVDLIEATVEMEALDSITEERLVAAIDTHKTDKIKAKKDDASWEPIREILDYWAERIRIRLDESRRWSM